MESAQKVYVKYTVQKEHFGTKKHNTNTYLYTSTYILI